MTPTYSYQCKMCGNGFEDFRPVSRIDEYTECPKCLIGMERVITSVENGFILKGTGWARDRYTGNSNTKWLNLGGDDES